MGLSRICRAALIVLPFALASAIAVPTAMGRVQEDATPVSLSAPQVEGLVTIESTFGVTETVDRLETAITEKGLIVVARVDHAANAEQAGENLRPTELLIFGNPALGTQLMQAEQTVGIDLPQKFLVWEAEDGTVYLSYNDPAYLAQRHGIEGEEEVLTQISNALANFATGATSA